MYVSGKYSTNGNHMCPLRRCDVYVQHVYQKVSLSVVFSHCSFKLVYNLKFWILVLFVESHHRFPHVHASVLLASLLRGY